MLKENQFFFDGSFPAKKPLDFRPFWTEAKGLCLWGFYLI